MSVISLVFCKHTLGSISNPNNVQPQPPFGLLQLASCIKAFDESHQVKVLDGKVMSEEDLVKEIDGDIVGFSIWFSNFEESCRIAKLVKNTRPNSTIIFGGPHATWIANRILANVPEVDYVFTGEADESFPMFLSGSPLGDIPGLVFRNPDVEDSIVEVPMHSPNLHNVPIATLGPLRPEFTWKGSPNSPAMSAFPISGIRGCPRSKRRCEYCSIHTIGYRMMRPEQYWRQVKYLHETHGIDYFFETGDIFAPVAITQFANHPDNCNVNFRIYSYPGYLQQKHIPDLKKLGVKVIFMGVESVLHWHGNTTRNYKSDHTIGDLLEEIDMLGEAGIDVWPGFLLGLPGENDRTLDENIALIRKVSQKSNVRELTASIVMPLPGSKLFQGCLENPDVNASYQQETGGNLHSSASFDFEKLTQSYVSAFTETPYSKLLEVKQHLKSELGSRMADWGVM